MLTGFLPSSAGASIHHRYTLCTINAAVHICIALDTMYRALLHRRPPKKPIFGFGRQKRRLFGAPKKKEATDWSPAQADFFVLGRFSLGGGDFCFLGFPPHPPYQYLNIYEVRGLFSSYGASGARNSESRGRRREDSDRHARQQSANTHTHGGRILFGGGRTSYLATEHHNEAAPKKKKAEVLPLGRRKIRF